MAIETSVEHEFFSNPSKEQKEYLTEAAKESNVSNGDIVGGESESSVSSPESILEKDTKTESQPLEEQEEKTISYTDKNTGETHNYTMREWEDEWNKNKVENQWQNWGRDKEDQYDQYTGLDFYGNDASKAISSVGVPKDMYLTGIRQTDENGNYKYQEKLDSVNKARREYTQNNLSKAINGAKALYDKTIGKAIDKVSAYKNDIGEKAREVSDKRNERYINDAKTLAKSNLGTSQPERKVTLEYDAAKFPSSTTQSSTTQSTNAYKPEVKMKVEGIEKPITKTQVEEIKKSVNKDLEYAISYYEKNPLNALDIFYNKSEMAKNKELGLIGLSYYDKEKLLETKDGTKIPTGTLTTELGHRVDIDINPKGDFSADNLKSMFSIGYGRQIGTATIHKKDGSTVTYTLHNDPKVNNNITVVDENGKQVGVQLNTNTPRTFMSDLSNVFDDIPGQAIDYESPTVSAGLEMYDEYIANLKNNIKALDNAQVDMDSLSTAYDMAIETSMPKVVVSDEGGDKEIIETKKGLEDTLSQFERPEDVKVATEWINNYTPMIEKAIENSKVDPVGNAGELAKVLDEARNALKPYANENFTNFNTAVNDYVGSVAGTYFINTQLYDRGVTADNAKEGLVDRIKTAYESDKMSFGQKVLYSLGFGNRKVETDEGVMQLRNIAEQSLGRTSNLSPNFKGAVMSSLLAQKVDNKSPISDMLKDFLAFGGIQAVNALSGFNPAVVGVTSLYAVDKYFERYLEEKTYAERNEDNQKRLESIKKGEDKKASPTTKSEKLYNDIFRGTGQDIKHVSLGVANLVVGTVTTDPSLVAYGVSELMKVDSLNKDVKEFVGPENLQEMSNIAVAPTTSEESETTSEEKKKKKLEDLEEVVTDGNKQDSLDGLNLPPISEDDMNWLIKQPFMENYEGIS